MQDVSDRVTELKAIIEMGKSEKDGTDRDLYQYWDAFREQQKKFNETFDTLICTLGEDELSDIIDEMEHLYQKVH